MLVSASKFFTLEPYNEVQVIRGVNQILQRKYINSSRRVSIYLMPSTDIIVIACVICAGANSI